MCPARSNLTVIEQIISFIPGHLVNRLAEKHGVKKQSRKLSPWSHVVSLIYAQLAHSLSLCDVVDALRNNIAALFNLRGATPPSRNGLSYANRNRNADMAQDLFWEVLYHLDGQDRNFIPNGPPQSSRRRRRRAYLPRRFTRAIYAVDSTTIQLVTNSLDWAKHRRRKAAAKCHMTLSLNSFMPSMIIVKAANTHDSTEAAELCAHLKAGEVVLFDKAYVDYAHLHALANREVNWVTRSKTNMAYEVEAVLNEPSGSVIRDVLVRLTGPASRKAYPDQLRLVEARVVVDGKEKVMIFMTNNLTWASSSIAELYKARWAIEVFFKQLKQTLKLSDFLGYNESAVRWQIWIALLTYVLLRFIAHRAKWSRSFARLFTCLRGVLWRRLDMYGVLTACGTADAPIPIRASPDQAYLPGFGGF